MGRFDIFPIFIATFASRRVTLIATHSKSQKQTRLPIRYLYFILPFKPLINKEVIKVFQNYSKSQLATLYLPHIQSASARRTLRSWIAQNTALQAALAQTGYSEKAILLTPAQVGLFFKFLGEP